jgi:signal peptidase II
MVGKKGSFVRSHLSSRVVALTAACTVLAFDQLTKQWALTAFATLGTTIKLAGPIDLTLVLNRSNAFGLIPVLGEFSRWALTAFSLVVTLILVGLVLRKSTSISSALGLALVSAGALGNALDRLRLGAVVDLFDASKLGFVWAFNVADVSIDLGIALILVTILFSRSALQKVEHETD